MAMAGKMLPSACSDDSFVFRRGRGYAIVGSALVNKIRGVLAITVQRKGAFLEQPLVLGADQAGEPIKALSNHRVKWNIAPLAAAFGQIGFDQRNFDPVQRGFNPRIIPGFLNSRRDESTDRLIALEVVIELQLHH